MTASNFSPARSETDQPVSGTPASSRARTAPTILTFVGAAGTVTGSKFLIDHGGSRAMVDCGLYQGERKWRRKNWEPSPVRASSIQDVVLTHAHLDHCGYLPALARQGFTGPVWCTEGTAALAEIILRDSAHLLERDADDARAGGWSKHDPPLPLYTSADAERAISLLRPVAYDTPTPLAPELELSLSRAGHILGSASALLWVGDARVLFSGDLGRPQHDLLLPRADPPGADVVVVESTYGDRDHPPADPAHPVMAQAIRETIGRGGSVIIPAFAIDRTELVLHTLRHLMDSGDIPSVPVYLDSPMALAALEVYRSPGLADELRPDIPQPPLDWSSLRLARSAEESKALNNPGRPCIIVSASGMASGGRVIHHLRWMLPHRRNTVILTGYQAVGTRGRDLQEGARALKMMGGYVPVRAQVVTDDGFSVHSDASETVAWLRNLPTPPETVYVVHGEPSPARALAELITDELGWCAVVPRLGERVRLP